MKIVDILIHINEPISLMFKDKLVEEIRSLPGVIAPRFSYQQKQLLLIAYNPEQICATRLLIT